MSYKRALSPVCRGLRDRTTSSAAFDWQLRAASAIRLGPFEDHQVVGPVMVRRVRSDQSAPVRLTGGCHSQRSLFRKFFHCRHCRTGPPLGTGPPTRPPGPSTLALQARVDAFIDPCPRPFIEFADSDKLVNWCLSSENCLGPQNGQHHGAAVPRASVLNVFPPLGMCLVTGIQKAGRRHAPDGP
jgi:hypothetical protein